MKYCDNCGTQLPEKASFCGKCGSKQDTLFLVNIAEVEQEDSSIEANTTDKPLKVDDSDCNDEFATVEQSDDMQVKRVRCPYCLEMIIEGARICRFCRSDLTGNCQQPGSQNIVRGNAFNWAILMCGAFLAAQVVIIILALTDLLMLNIELGYSGYNLYEYSFGLSIFSCFDISKFIEVLQNNAPSFTGQNMGVVLCIFGTVYLILVFAYLILFIWRLTEIYKDYKWCRKNKKRFVFDGYSIALSAVFISFVVIAWIYIGIYLSNSDISIVKIGLSPSMIAIIVIFCVQIAINIVAKHYDDAIYEEEKKTRSSHNPKVNKWLCNKCGSYNREDLDKCRSCGIPRRYTVDTRWICARCFKSNNQVVDHCIYCDYPKPSLYKAVERDEVR